jgi:hypothetical protein
MIGDPYKEEEERLIARGILSPPRWGFLAVDAWPEPPGDIPADVMRQIWEDERKGR